MHLTKKNIINELQNEILYLQGYKMPGNSAFNRVGLGIVENNFPNCCFPLAAIHEFLCSDMESTAATTGFICGVLVKLMRKQGITIWINSGQKIFPPALKLFGIEPDKIIFIQLHDQKQILWALEESLKSEGLAAVVGELKEIGFTASRRLQLAIEKSQVTGFILRHHFTNTIASVAKWKINHIPSDIEDGLPGVGFPRWNVQLLKARNGKPGNWQLEWSAGRFREISSMGNILKAEEKRKIG
jgi:protein ImuA